MEAEYEARLAAERRKAVVRTGQKLDERSQRAHTATSRHVAAQKARISQLGAATQPLAFSSDSEETRVSLLNPPGPSPLMTSTPIVTPARKPASDAAQGKRRLADTSSLFLGFLLPPRNRVGDRWGC